MTRRERKFLLRHRVNKCNEKIDAIAFSMWMDSKYKPGNREAGWLTYWEYYDIYLEHEKRNTYREHVIRSIDHFKKLTR